MNKQYRLVHEIEKREEKQVTAVKVQEANQPKAAKPNVVELVSIIVFLELSDYH